MTRGAENDEGDLAFFGHLYAARHRVCSLIDGRMNGTADVIPSAANPLIKRVRPLPDRNHRRREAAFGNQ